MCFQVQQRFESLPNLPCVCRLRRSPVTSCLISLCFFGMFCGGGAVCLAAVPCLRLLAECRAGTLKAWTLLVGGGTSRSLRCRGSCWCLPIAPEISSTFPVFMSWFSVWCHLEWLQRSHGHTHTHTPEAKVLPAHSRTAYILLDLVIQLILNLNFSLGRRSRAETGCLFFDLEPRGCRPICWR